MGYDQAEKVKAKIDKQKNCPYCHEKGAEHYVKMIQDIPGSGLGLMLRNGGWHIWTSLRLTYVVSLKPINYCPMCGRKLIGGNPE